MAPEKLSRMSKRMSTITLLFIALMLIINTAHWLLPGVYAEGSGFTINLAPVLSNGRQIDMQQLSGWQIFAGFVLSSVPLLMLAWGLWHLRKLFVAYSQGAWFSAMAACHMKYAGFAVAGWTLLERVTQPVIGLLATLYLPKGERVLEVSISASDFVALFVAGSIVVIAQILQRASTLHAENQAFI